MPCSSQAHAQARRGLESSRHSRSPQSRGITILFVLALAVAFSFSVPHLRDPGTPSQSARMIPDLSKVPTQGDQLYTFTSCSDPSGNSCLTPDGGIDTPLVVGTTVALEFFSSAFCTTPITGTINWGDGSATQSQTISSGPCQCTFGPFSHTFNSVGSFNTTISDTCDGSELLGAIPVVAAGLGFDVLLIALGAILGLVAVAVAAASFRAPRLPPGSAALMPVVTGSFMGTPGGTAGVAIPSTLDIPLLPGETPAGGWPAWALDYRTTPYVPNPLIQGWPQLLQRFQAGKQPPDAPNWPALNQPAPPTMWPGVFCQARVNPQTGHLRWWNPIDGTFPWG